MLFINTVQYVIGKFDADVKALANLTCMDTANINGVVLTRFPKSTKIHVVNIVNGSGPLKENLWGSADCDGKPGYIPMNQTQPVDASNPATPFAYVLGSFGKNVILFDLVYCFSGRNYSSTLMNQLPNDTMIQISYVYDGDDKTAQWGSCTCNGVAGYIPLTYTYPEVLAPKTIVTAAQLASLGWADINTLALDELNYALNKYAIITAPRVRHFLSQAAAESSLGASKVNKTGEQYENRKDLGNTAAGDGMKFRGVGYIQFVGKLMYQAFANSIGDARVMNGAEFVSNQYPWAAAAFWWSTANMNTLADTQPTVDVVTKRVDGNTLDLAKRQAEYDKCVKVIV